MGIFPPAPLAVPSMAEYRSRDYDVKGPGTKDKGRVPTFSVVMPVYNGEAYIEEAIRSVAAQDGEDFELIVVDGASKDRTLDIVQDNAGLVDRWISGRDVSMYDAINKGLSLCRGRYVHILNADDLLTPQSMKMAREAFERHGDRIWLRSNLEVVDERGEVLELLTTKRMIRYFPVFLHPTWYLPLSLYEELGLYATKYRIASDAEYAMRLAHHGVEAIHLEAPLAQFRTGGMSQGFTGAKEAFDIHRRYIGDAKASYIAGMLMYKKLRFHAVARVLGPERAHTLRTWLKGALGRT